MSIVSHQPASCQVSTQYNRFLRMASRIAKILAEFRPDFAPYEELYRHFHANPELSRQEQKTAAKISEQLRQFEFKVHERIGGYGLVAVLENGPGKTVLLRADIDALPVEEKYVYSMIPSFKTGEIHITEDPFPQDGLRICQQGANGRQ